MSVTAAPAVDDPPVGGGAMPGVRLLWLVQRMMRTGLAMARGINRIARQRLEGQDLARMAPAGFNATLANALVVQAVAWTAALRERLLVLAVRPAFVPRQERVRAARGREARAPRDRDPDCYLPEATGEPEPGDWHDWRELARPWRMGPRGVAVAARAIAGLSSAEVVTAICSKLSQAAEQLGAEADVGRIAAMEAEARALCPEAAASPAEAGDPGGKSEGASGGWEPGVSPHGTETDAENDPPPKPPD